VHTFRLTTLIWSWICLATPLAATAQAPMADPTTAPALSPATARSWIVEMKSAPRGPFSRLRWFCADGSVLEPSAYSCADHGGGVQHGEWTERTRQLRAAGYPIANVLADLKPADFIGADAPPDRLSMILLEKFLIAFDDGWILRQARFYRGAFQEYNERDSASAILLALLGDPHWRQQFLMLRETARLLPHGADSAVLTEMRGLATSIAARDPRFDGLRSKIHLAPDVDDAQRVLDYAHSAQSRPELQAEYQQLAQTITTAYTRKPLSTALRSLAARTRPPDLARQLRAMGTALDAEPGHEQQLRIAADAMALIRSHLLELGLPSVRLIALDTSLQAGVNAFSDSRQLLDTVPRASRAHLLDWLDIASQAMYGMGLLSYRELGELSQALEALARSEASVGDYRRQLQILERAPAWAARRLEYHFGDAIERFEPIEPLASMFVPDRLRGSVMLFYSSVVELLARDADQLGGTERLLFGRSVGSDLRRLNPGLARGVLMTAEELRRPGADPSRAIVLVPETTADLPAVAGILTANEGNALSHVQLLARNLGIPNVVVGPAVLEELQRARGHSIVVAASNAGVVHIEHDGPQWDAVFDAAAATAPATTIAVDLDKLDLDHRDPIQTRQLRSTDAGRIVGPKAAGVGELTQAFPDHVSAGLAIPFGEFRALLDQPLTIGTTTPSMFDWMRTQYAELARLKTAAPQRYPQRRAEFLAFVQHWIAQAPLDPAFLARLQTAMRDTFGEDGSYGVFVRSDTNVEDLPGFTGAGLNKTVPNVVGFDAIVAAIRTVWASPFSERAFSWRQSLMDHPEHVYASVLLHRSVPSEKSGVLVTADIDTGDRGTLTVVTSPGVGGGVDGQAAEALRINLNNSVVHLLSSSSARTQRVLPPTGGIVEVHATAPDYLLHSNEIAQLTALARALPRQMPQLVDGSGQPAPADVEFGFVDERLMLFQIRPFLQNRTAARSRALLELDAALAASTSQRVNMMLPPLGESP
jgi:hypothetical protein